MATEFLMNEKIEYFEIWEKSPRLPESIQNKLTELSSDEKIKEMMDYYILNEDLLTLAAAISSVGVSPIEPIHAIQRNGKLVIFDGIRRYMAIQVLLYPALASNQYHKIKSKELYEEMSEENRKTLKDIPVIKYHPSIYTLEFASQKTVVNQLVF